jgi:uncharacterized membrane protein
MDFFKKMGYNYVMANDKFSIKEAMKYGWDTFKANVPFFIGFMVLMALLTIVPDAISDKIFEPKSAGLITVKIILRLVGLILGMVSTRISLDIHDTGEPNLSKLGELLPQIPSYLFGKILYGLIVLVGLVLLIVPGIIVAYMFLYVGYLIIDRGMGPIAALQESRVLTEGYKMDLFLFSLVVAGVNILGVICLFVGLFVTIPTTLMASVYVYRRLSPQEAV